MYKIIETEVGFECYYLLEGTFKDKWIPFITYNGSKDAYTFSSKNNAENALLMEIKKHYIIHQTNGKSS